MSERLNNVIAWMNTYSTPKNPEKNRQAYLEYDRAIRNKKLVRPDTCQRCNRKPKEPVIGHHTDYSKPLKVIWLCPRCHREVHSKAGFVDKDMKT